MSESDSRLDPAVLLAHRPLLVRFARRYVGDDAEDAVQDACLRILALGASGARPREFAPYAMRAVRNVCLNRLRAAARRKDVARLPTALDVEQEATGPLTRLARGDDATELTAQLARLSPAQREVLLLRYVDGLDRSAIAEVLELSESVVKSRLFEAVDRLRKRL
jgi:RNA polymerase sigma factor (sigma-70 family)